MPGARAQQRSGGGLTSVHIWLIVFVVLWLGSTVAFVVLLTGREALTNQNTDLLTENNLLITLAEKNELSRYRDRTGPGMSMIGVVEKERQDTVALITGSGLDDLATARAKQSGLVQQIRSDGLVDGVTPDDALLTTLTTVYDRLTNLQDAFDEMRQSNQALTRNSETLTQKLAQQEQMFGSSTEALAETVASDAADIAAFREQSDQQVEGLNQQIAQMEDDQIEQIRVKDGEVSQLQRQIARLEEVSAAQQSRLEANRPPVDPTRVAWQPDGSIVGALPGDPRVYIDIGRKHNLILGMQFQVYSRNREPGPDGRGKATIKVVGLQQDAAECQVLTTTSGNPIVEGDVVANAIFDRHRKFAFVVSGRFDLDHDGDFELDGRERIQALVEEWGGRVVSELSETTDFVVVGQRPAIPLVDPGSTDPNDRQRVLLAEQALAQFNALKQDARVLSIPVLTQAQFQAFIGYTTQDALPTRF